jgi:hypothetical protein
MTATCPVCGTLMAVPEDLAGGDVECPQCGLTFPSVLEDPPEYVEPALRRYYDDEPRNRRADAQALLRPCAIALIVVTSFRLMVNSFCAISGGFFAIQGGINPGSAVIVAITWLNFAMSAIILFGAWQMLNAQSFGWGLAASILSMIPTLEAIYCLPWLVELGFGIWACVIINNADVCWLIRETQKERARQEDDGD